MLRVDLSLVVAMETSAWLACATPSYPSRLSGLLYPFLVSSPFQQILLNPLRPIHLRFYAMPPSTPSIPTTPTPRTSTFYTRFTLQPTQLLHLPPSDMHPTPLAALLPHELQTPWETSRRRLSTDATEFPTHHREFPVSPTQAPYTPRDPLKDTDSSEG